ncbi:MAG: DUF983 domain-containing protein [Planctomycetota bacterium]|jgi:uncharacterized protein (DUF983 family)
MSFLNIVRRGLRRRCPHCGDGRIFLSFTKLRRSCSGCGWIVEREPGAVTGAMYAISIISMFLAIGLWLLMAALTDWSEGVMIAIALPLIALFSYMALPVTKGFWIAVEYWTDHATGKAAEPDYEQKAFEREPDD